MQVQIDKPRSQAAFCGRCYTRVEASSMSAASVYSCSARQIDVRHARVIHCAGTWHLSRSISISYITVTRRRHRLCFCVQQGHSTQLSGLVGSCYTHLGVWGSERRGAGCGVLDVHVHCVPSSSMQVGLMWSHEPCLWLWSCESVDFACFTSDCDAPQLYTDAAPVLY